jgi:hypothetical protein
VVAVPQFAMEKQLWLRKTKMLKNARNRDEIVTKHQGIYQIKAN